MDAEVDRSGQEVTHVLRQLQADRSSVRLVAFGKLVANVYREGPCFGD